MDFNSIDVKTYDKLTFGKCIKEQRIEKGITLRKAASGIGISAVYLYDIEKGARPAPINNNLDIIYKIGSALSIPEDQMDTVIDMAYFSHGYHSDIEMYLSQRPNARKFIRRASELDLSDDEWENLLKEINKRQEVKTLRKVRGKRNL